jgi:1-deoxy-D-xylulose-5-phosphate reductoisomerase
VSELRRVTLLGSTGSIGTQAIDIALRAPDRIRIVAISAAGSDLELLARQAAQLHVEAVGVADPGAAEVLSRRIEELWQATEPPPVVISGEQATEQLAIWGADVVLNAVAGAQGLRATLASLDAGLTVALANKESLVAGGSLVTSRARPGQLIPVDSEHSALAQCLRGGSANEVRRLVLTASGGPFRGRSRDQLAGVTPAQALAHPTWEMGRLVTTNSATLVNKGLEMIEAHLFFDVPYDRIDVVVHPQSVIHSMVEFVDGSTIAQASPPDMRLPIALALDWPNRIPDAAAAVDWSVAHSWTFEPLDTVAFPAVGIARVAGVAGGCAPAVFNAANEQLVSAFHAGSVSFLSIVDLVAEVLDEWLRNHHATAGIPGTVEDVERAEAWARVFADQLIGRRR